MSTYASGPWADSRVFVNVITWSYIVCQTLYVPLGLRSQRIIYLQTARQAHGLLKHFPQRHSASDHRL